MEIDLTSDLICTVPVTPDGDVRITVSANDRETLEKYPMAMLIIDEHVRLQRSMIEYCRVQRDKDVQEEIQDASADLAIFEAKPIAKEMSNKPDLRNDDSVCLGRSTKILYSPVEALIVSQIWAKGCLTGTNRFGIPFRTEFFEELASLVAPKIMQDWDNKPEATRLHALDVFLEQLHILLMQWKRARGDCYRWWRNNREEVGKLQRAQSRILHEYGGPETYLAMGRIFMPWELDQGQDFWGVNEHQDPVWCALEGAVVLDGQGGIRDTARSVAYLVFRQVILRRIRVSFCAGCHGVKVGKKKQKFCCDYCREKRSSISSKSRKRADASRDRIAAARLSINYWLANRYLRKHFNWREYVEQDLRNQDLIEAKGKSQIVGQWVNTSHTAKGSYRRRRLIRLCTKGRCSSQQGQEVCESINRLLTMIVRAERVYDG